ncbi:cyclophilin 40 isoform X1 [Osmia lignaria lignaria]|uniref:cyclophilin 40 isoform X1 n=3 Tax=Osmia lignaria TaxID=473952 RepID=UPI001478DCEC|nr:peptidyl-prolyl cis-trans isomerase D-like isoform X1 [Osmia lignaria]
MEDSSKDTADSLQNNPIIFLDIAIESEKVGRIVIELFKDVVPRTSENFRALCTGEKGIGINGKKLHYKGSIFHKVLPQFMIQGGDIINFDGTSGESIYGAQFEDENFKLCHSSGGLLSMVNEGYPNSNSSQFIITISASTHLDGTNVVFGKVLKGMGVILEISQVETMKDAPVRKVHIMDCGELKQGQDWGLNESDGTEDIFTPWPEDWDYCADIKGLDYKYMIQVIMKIKDSGNHYFLQKHYVDAGRKYKKALRYYKWMMRAVDVPDPSDQLIVNVKVTLLLNLAAVKLKEKNHRDVLKLCTEVLQINKNNSKALFRRSQAYMGLNEYDLGLADLKQALLESPNNKDILQEMDKVKNVMKKYLAIERASCQRMFK